MKYSVYLAGSVVKGNHDKDKFISWREDFIKEVKNKNIDELNIIFLDPNTITYGDKIPTEIFFGRDVHMIHLSNALVIDARNKMGLGTSQEFLIAKYFGIPVIAISPKNSYYNKVIEKEDGKTFHYLHPFLSSSSDIIVSDIQEAAQVFLGHISGKDLIQIKSIDLIEKTRKDYEENYLIYDDYMQECIRNINN
ncbi:MAG: hypothetical protein QM490_06040 [Candidatus Gracilibacteria bacterium]